MSWRRRIGRIVLAALCLAGPAGAALAAEGTELQPYQMVRSLQLVQDRIASGDHAALPMQRKLLEMIDRRFRGAATSEFSDKRNFTSLLVYAMSGGNPATIGTLLDELPIDGADRELGYGILNYLSGNPGAARSQLRAIDPMSLSPEIGAFLALVRGSIMASEDQAGALAMFDDARLLGTGTLVEEAALRRSLPLAAQTLDAPRFLLAGSQYVRRFLQSPYASQFADGFVAGVVALHGRIELPQVDEIVVRMDPERRRVIYLRLARRAAIDGLQDLAEYASARADEIGAAGAGEEADPRSLLYSSLATVTSDTVDDVLARLRGIDKSRLSESDRQLLAAAEAIGRGVTAPPPTPRPQPAAERPLGPPDDGREPAATELPGSQATDTQPEGELPVAEPLDGPSAGAARAETAAPAPAAADAAPSAPPGAAAAAPAEAEPALPIVADTRKKLDEVDELLKDTAQ